MRIENCEFPDDLLYDEDGLLWVRRENSGEIVMGITSIQAALAGRLTKVHARPANARYGRGKSLGTLESESYFGAIHSPVRGTLIAINDAVLANPKLLSESPYSDGWFARLRPTDWEEDRAALRLGPEAKDLLTSQMARLHVHCFTAFPDYELFEIGTECAAVLAKLDELMRQVHVGDVVHLVSDDWTAPVEMENWSHRSGQPVLESRKEGTLYHFLVRKVA